MLAVSIVKEQGIEIEALHIQTVFRCCRNDAHRAAHELGVGFTTLAVEDDYLKMIEKPRYGWGRAVNPCVDCRIYMFRMAQKLMTEIHASFIVSGEVLAQRPMSQKKKDFQKIEAGCGLEGLILRPLSAKLLAITKPEEAGIVDRSKLYGIEGRSRLKLLEIAAKYGIKNIPSPSAGCSLTSPAFAKKVRDVFKYHPDSKRWEFEILKMGRHFRLDQETKIVIARNHAQNVYLEHLHPVNTTLITCHNFAGPHALLIGANQPKNLETAQKLILRYAQKQVPALCEFAVKDAGETKIYNLPSEQNHLELERLRIV